MGYRRLGVKSQHRKAMLRNMVTSLFKNGKIETTETRAKEVSTQAEKMITLGKKGDLAARRAALAYIMEEEVVSKLFAEIAPQYAERQGGYTRIISTGQRKGDGAPLAILELV